jgi:hypothetical protein
MTLKQKQKLVYLVSKGKNTYGEIRNAMPEIDETELFYTIRPGIEEHQLFEEVSPHPPSSSEPYTLLPDDKLVLNDNGQNILDAFRKEQHDHIVCIISTSASIIAAVFAVASYFR